ncbi:MAG: bifunctional UDP-N-acetylglucosamine diphosphorylase/glucosamine-1-phosphate N-acetyltransferase GlmU [Nitrospinae bacterium]|nr:bifunctional UDP-N-acetylglucosamine diphosphorylase/glucosamine-1-phosphate N-acetyltransferase GlmU [Nitrospinota bacterium]
MTPLATVILAAGKGTRMRCKTAKALQPVGGQPTLCYPFQLAQALGATPVVVVLGYQAERVKDCLPDEGWVAVEQREQQGTGHAVQQTAELLKDFPGDVLVLYTDVPLLRVETLQALLETHRRSGAVATVLTATMDHPGRLGRIVRDQAGHVLRIVEALDATEAERALHEVNTGTCCFQASALYPALQHLRANNAKGEYYLTDVIGDACRAGLRVEAVQAQDWREALGVDSKADLALAEAILRGRTLERLMAGGVTVLDPQSTYVHAEVQVGQDTVLYPNTYLLGKTVIGEDCEVWPNSVIRDSTLGDGVSIFPSCVITGRTIASGSHIGPFAHLRPESVVGEEVRIGNFVEVKKSRIGKGSKAAHLSYIGDVVMGKDVNVGAGFIACNYDGEGKFETVVEDEVFIGSDSQIIAPRTIGQGAYIATGTTVRKDVPPHALVYNPKEQVHRENWALQRKTGHPGTEASRHRDSKD